MSNMHMHIPNLHSHSYFTFGEGVLSPDKLSEISKERGFSHIAITDTNFLSGAVSFYKACMKNKITPIIGAEIKDNENKRIRIIAKNFKSYGNLCRIITDRHINKNFSIVKDLYSNNLDDLIFFTDDIFLLSSLYHDLQAPLYAEIKLLPHLMQNNRSLAEYCNKNDIETIITPASYFSDYKEYEIYRYLIAIHSNRLIKNLKVNDFDIKANQIIPKAIDFKNRAIKLFPKAFSNSVKIANDIDFDFPIGNFVFPKPKLKESNSDFDELYNLCQIGLKQKYNAITPKIVKRLAKELDIINDKGFTGYFLFVYDIILYCKKNDIIWICRGSGVNSIVCYLLDISNIDPIKYDLYFERFLNEERNSPPDIDIDFAYRDWNKVRQYILNKWGKDKVAAVSSVVTFGIRGAFRVVAKALALDLKKAKHIGKGILSLPPDKIWEKAKQIATKIEDFPYHHSIHCGGIVAVPSLITNYTPLMYANKHEKIMQLNMHDIEDIGGVKLDLLSLRAISVYKECIKYYKKFYPDRNLFSSNPHEVLNDIALRERLKNGNVIGCSHLESPAQRQNLKRLRADSLDIVSHSCAGIRPGVSASGALESFTNRHRDFVDFGKEPEYLHESLIPILKNTYGVIVYQEQLMRVVIEALSLPLSLANEVRKGISGKTRDKKRLSDIETTIIDAAINKGFNLDGAIELFRHLKSFAGYSFTHGHSLSRSALGIMQLPYLHYTSEIFFAAVLKHGGGYFPPSIYINEARRMGLKIYPADINKSSIFPRPVKDKGIRIGFSQVKHLDRNLIKAIIDKRKDKPFKSVSDFVQRHKCSLRSLLHMILAGLFRSVEDFDKSLNEYFNILYRKGLKLNINKAVLLDSIMIQGYRELAYFNACIRAHPIDVLLDEPPDNLENKKFIDSRSITKYDGKRISIIGFATSYKGTRVRNDGKKMAFLSLEDKWGNIETVLFPKSYKKNRRAIYPNLNSLFLVDGIVKKENYTSVIIVKKLTRLAKYNVDELLDFEFKNSHCFDKVLLL